MPRAIVLGGYGLIGAAVMAALREAGFRVTGVGRSRAAAMACDPGGDWIIRDIPRLSVAEWRGLLAKADVVVNAAGALQDGGRDDLRAIHVDAIRHLLAAIDGLPLRLVQISAAGAGADASTAFMRTKAEGDALIAASRADWVILRPTLVLAADAYGGTALLRAVAALPGILPRVLAHATVQTVDIADVARAVVMAAEGAVPAGTIADLTEAEARPFPDLVARMRAWLGYPAARIRPGCPDRGLRLAGHGADLLGRLGWRSPLRTTALQALGDGIRGDPAVWQAIGGPCRSLDETLTRLRATRQDRLFARMQLVLPLAIGVLGLFWSASGLVTLAAPGRAVAILTDRGVPQGLAAATALGGAVADLALGLAILWRPLARAAALGMTVLASGYLLGSLIAAPDLWADPLGPMLKVLPTIVLSAMVWLVIEPR